jgi:hypothetical protein
MAFDQNHSYTGTFVANNDRLGFNTPDPDASDILRPYLPVSYPAPWLPTKRQDLAHPIGANKIMSVGYLVGQDKSGALIPAGYFSGDTGEGGSYCLVKYESVDYGWAHNPKDGKVVDSGSNYCLLAAPSEAQVGDSNLTGTIEKDAKIVTIAAGADAADVAKVMPGQKITIAGLADKLTVATKPVTAESVTTFTVKEAASAAVAVAAAITYEAPVVDGITLTAADIAFAKACDLIPGGVARAVGYAIRDIYQYVGGVEVSATTGGMSYKLDGVIPTKFKIHNYKHEAGNAVQTCFVLRLPWIGATPTKLQELAAADSLSYTQTDFSRSFVHFTGEMGNKLGNLFVGAAVVPSTLAGDAGHYMPFDPAKHSIDSKVGRVIGVEAMYPIRDYMDRVRTQFDRANSFVGPFRTANPVTGMLGGSATRGMDTTISYATNGLFRTALDAGKTIHPEYGTYVYVAVRTL